MESHTEVELGPARHQAPSDQRQILCLSGGGYRGLYTALVLEALEQRAKDALADCFDVIAGTSIGAWIASALALRMPAANIRAAVENHGPVIFDSRLGVGRFRLPLRNRLRHLYRSRYSKAPLRDAIDAIFGAYADAQLSEISTPLVIATVDAGAGAPLILMSSGLAGNHASDLSLRDALLATSAAPSYFPFHQVVGRALVDGGIVANAPDLVALTETIRHLGCGLNDIRVLSIGTAAAPHVVQANANQPGLLAWLVRHGLVQLTLSAQEQLAVEQSKILLRDRYLRLDHSSAQSAHGSLGLDVVTEASTAALHQAADATIRTFSKSNRAALRRFLSHQSQGPRRPPIAYRGSRLQTLSGR